MGDDEKFSTSYTMVDLEYNKEDIVECLKGLNIADYSETKVDKDNTYPPLLYTVNAVKYLHEWCEHLLIAQAVCHSFYVNPLSLC